MYEALIIIKIFNVEKQSDTVDTNNIKFFILVEILANKCLFSIESERVFFRKTPLLYIYLFHGS
jgi:hypothetical protein